MIWSVTLLVVFQYLEEIKRLVKTASCLNIIFVVNKIENTEDINGLQDDNDSVCLLDEMDNLEAPFLFNGKQFHPKELIDKSRNVLQRWELLHLPNELVGISARLSGSIRYGLLMHNHIEMLSENYFTLERLIGDSFKNGARLLIDKVAGELFMVQKMSTYALMYLSGHIQHTRCFSEKLLEQYVLFEKELFGILKKVMGELSAVEIMNQYKESHLQPKVSSFFVGYGTSLEETTTVKRLVSKFFDDLFPSFNKNNKSSNKSTSIQNAKVMQSLLDFCDTIALMCSRQLKSIYNEKVGTEALNRAQKLLEILGNLNSFNNSDIFKQFNSPNNTVRVKNSVVETNRTIRMIQKDLDTMLGAVNKKVIQHFSDGIKSQLNEFFLRQKVLISSRDSKWSSDELYIQVAMRFLQHLKFDSICDNIHSEAKHSLEAGHNSTMQLIQKVKFSFKNLNPRSKELLNEIENSLKCDLGTRMIQMGSLEFETFNQLGIGK